MEGGLRHLRQQLLAQDHSQQQVQVSSATWDGEHMHAHRTREGGGPRVRARVCWVAAVCTHTHARTCARTNTRAHSEHANVMDSRARTCAQALRQQLEASEAQQQRLEQLLRSARTEAQHSQAETEAELGRVRAEAARTQAQPLPDSLWALLQALEAELLAPKGSGGGSSRSSHSDLASLPDQSLGAVGTPRLLPAAGSAGSRQGFAGLAGLALLEGQRPDRMLTAGEGVRAAEAVVHQAVLALRTLREQHRKMAKVGIG